MADKFFKDYLSQPFEHNAILYCSIVKFIALHRNQNKQFLKIMQIVDPPLFAIPWILTWFSHNFEDYETIK